MIYFDLRKEAKNKTIGNAVARDVEMRRIARTLKRQYNNHCLINGASGTGKSALLEAFAYQAASGNIPGFEKYNLIKLESNNFKRLLAQATNPEVQNFILAAFKSIPGETIIFIDDFDSVIPEQKFSELNHIFAQLEENKNIRLCLAASRQKFEKLHQENPAFFQNFEIIELRESDSKETLQILKALAPAFEKEYGIKIKPESLEAAADLGQKISSDKKMPLKAMHLLDEALALVKINNAAELGKAEVFEIFSEKTGVPAAALTNADAAALKNLEQELGQNVIGQDLAVQKIADIVRRGRMGLRNPHRPIGSFLFLGPSGVGKTELSKVLAKTVYGSERSFTRIDMSEFGEQHTVQRLIGAPPGYVGFEAGGQLTNSLSQQPYSLVLLDEIEKAHPKIFDIFLQVFEDGRLTDGQGKTVNFSHSILIATSNIGIKEIVEAHKHGVDVNGAHFIEQQLMPVLLKHFRTEFLNRFDAVIVFNPLSAADLFKIALLEIRKIEQRTSEHGIRFNIDPEILKRKINEIIDPRFGARPIKRFIEQTCESLIAMKILNDK